MVFTFYKNTSDSRKIGKSLESLGSLNCQILEPCKLLNPIITIETNSQFFYQSNYVKAEVEPFNKFYFIESYEMLKGGRIKLNLKVDVLETYKESILNLETLVLRQENIGVNHITDNKLPLMPYSKERVVKFDNSQLNINTADETSYNFILNVSGGAVTNNETE